MKKIDPFSISLICIWIIGINLVIPEIIALKRRGQEIPSVELIIMGLLSVLLIISALGIWFRKIWARILYFIISIFMLIAFLWWLIYSAIKEGYYYTLVLYIIMLSSPWLGILIYGLYYLNRKDIRASFGLVKNNKLKNIEK